MILGTRLQFSGLPSIEWLYKKMKQRREATSYNLIFCFTAYFFIMFSNNLFLEFLIIIIFGINRSTGTLHFDSGITLSSTGKVKPMCTQMFRLGEILLATSD